MGKVYSELNDQLRELIEAQHLFFVATAPTVARGAPEPLAQGARFVRGA